ncbi:ABC transporter transmembrane domain-containing protein [Flavobacterium sp.]|uniref:ABC transporter transmembrane domain-containing protein n=1 Tax=Flavobacterium sp. TaxID=239 RepID=UPI003F69E982
MNKTDTQLKSNDCGISAVKTVFNIFNTTIDRKYIENKIPLEEKGSRLSDLKDFFNTHNFIANYKLLDINYIQGNIISLKELFPFILPVQNRNGLHYVVVTDVKKNKLKILDPSKGSEYFLSIQELKKKSHYNKTSWSFADTDEKIIAICSHELEKYNINIYNELEKNDSASLFNKLTYFSYLNENFGFKNFDAEKDFLIDLLNNQEIGIIPKHFKTLKYNNDKLKITAPLILTIKEKEQKADNVDFPLDENKSMYWQLFKQLGQYKQLWYIYIFAALFSASTTQLAIFTNQILIDEILPSYNLGMLAMFAIGLGIYKLFDLGTSIYKSFVGIHLGNVLDKYFLNTFDSKINSFSLPYIHSYKKGDLVERISDAIKLKTFFLRFFTNVLIDVFVSIYSLAILFYINWKLTFIVVGVMILFYGWFKFITPTLKQNERLRYVKKAEFLSKMIEKVEGIQVIKSFKIEFFHSNKISKSINEYLKIQLKNGYIDLINKAVVALIIIISSIVILYYITNDAIVNQLITLGQIVTFISLSGRIFSSLKGILDENLTLQENEVILKRFLDFDEIKTTNVDNGIKDFTIDKFEIQNLSFGYFSNEPIIKGINLIIHKGNKIKIEGNNGSGKSTLSKILTALYTPITGKILINENNRSFYDNEQIKNKILLVSNEDILFNDTIMENICLGRDIPTKRILEYAKKIDFYDFVASKDEGLEYIINENGKNLSTGQRKKILLLRAFFSNSEIIILDEVLSGMDNESRVKVEKWIDGAKEKTFIIISHEPITNINFDIKYKLKNGELTEI